MIEKRAFEVLDGSSNAIVARSPDRQFPGVLVQGDTLRILFDDISELSELLKRRDYSSAVDTVAAIEEQLFDLLRHYEGALKKHEVTLPYAEPVSNKTQ
jgi:hypothetical protein